MQAKWSALAGALVVWYGSDAHGAAPDPAAPEWDATHVRTEVPATVNAGQVFEVR